MKAMLATWLQLSNKEAELRCNLNGVFKFDGGSVCWADVLWDDRVTRGFCPGQMSGKANVLLLCC